MIIFKVGYNKNSFTSALGKWYGSIISVETMNSQTDKLVEKRGGTILHSPFASSIMYFTVFLASTLPHTCRYVASAQGY